MYERANLLAVHHFLQITHNIHIKHIDRQVVVLTHADGCQVHHLQATRQYLLICDLLELRSRRILLWISGIDTIHTGTFQHHVGLDLDAAQAGTSICSKVW